MQYAGYRCAIRAAGQQHQLQGAVCRLLPSLQQLHCYQLRADKQEQGKNRVIPPHTLKTWLRKSPSQRQQDGLCVSKSPTC